MKAKDILHRASITLQDKGNVRWLLTELLMYLNDGMREIANHKPNAVTDSVELNLVEGTLQELPAEYVSLVRVTRNLKNVAADAGGRKGGVAITTTSRSTLDVAMPGWQDDATLPFHKDVVHVIQDMASPREFFVVPGNDGTGVIEAVVSVLPVDIAEPASNALQMASYAEISVPMPAIYLNPLVDYVISRAYAKDSADPSGAQLSQRHYASFAAAIGLKVQADQLANVNTTNLS